LPTSSERVIEVRDLAKRYRLGESDVLHGSLREALARAGAAALHRARGRRSAREWLWALDHVSFDVTPGEVLGIVGRNGAGKTTLLKLLSGITDPTEGEARIWGRVGSLLEVGTGFHGDLTGRENIFLNGAILGMRRREIERKFDEIVAFAEVERFIDTPVKRYSSGMYLRFAFSVAINMDPDILLADEILAVGDLSFRERCLQRVEQAGSEGMTVLFVSHDMATIRRISKRVLWLNNGNVVAAGEPDEVVDAYERAAWLSLSDFQGGESDASRNAFGAIRSVQIVSATDEEIGAVRVADEFYLKITYAIFKPGVTVRCVFDVFCRDVHAFRTPQPWAEEVGQPGIFTARVRVPAHLLSETKYSVTMWVVIKEGEQIHALVRKGAVAFQVFDSDPARSARGTYVDRLPGVLTPKLEWRVAEEGADGSL
jgi:lipopolysaccharide transport system ATP-binding protein